MKYLFRFTVQSRKLYTRTSTSNDPDDRFLEMLMTLFREFTNMMGKAYAEDGMKLQVRTESGGKRYGARSCGRSFFDTLAF